VGASTSVSWPAGVGAKGNEGVAGLVQQTPNTIGYVELVFALQNQMTYGRVENQAGHMILPALGGVTAAAASAEIPDDFRVSITNAAGEDSYPISSFTWLLAPTRIDDPVKREALTSFLHWMIEDGQGFASKLGYAPLPDSVRAREIALIAKIH
jgi:phosphate transport system substrate-binding protein